MAKVGKILYLFARDLMDLVGQLNSYLDIYKRVLLKQECQGRNQEQH